jgi:hypothetical protein
MERAVVDGKGVPPPSNCPIPWQLSFSFQQPSPFCHPERTWVSYITALNSATYVVLPKENHMQLTEAATLDRKSGEAEGSAVRHSGAPNLPFYNSKLPPQSPSSSEALRGSIEIRWLYGAESKDPGDACWQMLLGAFRQQTPTKVKKSQTPITIDGSPILRQPPRCPFLPHLNLAISTTRQLSTPLVTACQTTHW